MKFLHTTIGMVALFAAVDGMATEYYVDGNISATCNNYAAATRNCVNGSDTAFADLTQGLSALAPGDTLILRAGNYGQLNIQVSGTQSTPITIQGMTNEVVTITTGLVGLWIINKSDVAISDITVTNVEGFGRLEGSTRISIDNVNFSNAIASGTTGSLKFVRSPLNRVSNSTFEAGSDLLILQDNSDRNVLTGNSFGRATHSLISIRCSSQNIIRGNVFDNPDQKAIELYDCEGVSDAPVRLDDARRNVIEWNRFNGTASSTANYRFNAIQHGGQQSIVRFNVFTENLGGGVNYQYYADESLFVYGNRLYNNTFFNNRCYAIIGQNGPSNRFYDNRVVNNLLYQNQSCSGGGTQVSISSSATVILTDNSQVTADPGFINAIGGDFHLQTNSQEIDAGRFVASVAASGSGTAMPVDDASWFYDGFGIAAESGDLIQLDGTSAPIRVVAIDYATNTLNLQSSTTWVTGQGVHVAFTGNSPDVGAFEYSATSVAPNPPQGLQAQ